MARDRKFFFVITDGTKGADTESFIKAGLDHEQIHRWAYILHDKEYCNEHDMKVRYYGLQYSWADGFAEMVNYASKDEYIEEQMKKPPLPGDKLTDCWYIFCITDKNCDVDQIAEWFGLTPQHIHDLTEPSSILDRMKMLTNEDSKARSMERHIYPDAEVKANFDFREYMSNIKPKPKLEKLLRILRPAPFPKKNKK